MPHYQESLAIKNVVAGLEGEDLSTADKLNPSESHKFVLQSLTKDVKNPRAVNKATLSASVTHQKIAFVYMKVRFMSRVNVLQCSFRCPHSGEQL